MTSRNLLRNLMAAFAMTSMVSAGFAAETSAPTYTHRSETGTSAFAVGLKYDGQVNTIERHVLLIDTSASQIGVHRQHSLSVLKGVLKNLPAHHQVALLAVDVQAASLTEGFVAPQGTEMQAALKQLAIRAPLGATDIGGALSAAIELCSGDTAVSIDYIGDGMSAAGLLNLEQLERMHQNLRDHRAVVNCFAVGPNHDLNLLGLLTQQTGGRIFIDDEKVDVGKVATELTAAMQQGVVYPTEISVATTQRNIELPSLPLRRDENLFLIGRGELPVDGRVRATIDGKEQTWAVEVQNKGADIAFLGSALQTVRDSRGQFAGYSGDTMFWQASKQFSGQIEQMKELAQRSLSAQEFGQVRDIALAMKQLDPENNDVNILLAAAEKKQQLVAYLQDDAAQPATPPAPPKAPTPQVGDADQNLIELEKQGRKLKGDALTLEVNNLIREARKLSDANAANAIKELKLALGTVRSAIDIDAEVRKGLEDRLGSVLLEVQAKQEMQELQQSQVLARQTEQQALGRLRAESELAEEKFQMLLERVRALMIEGYHEFDDTSFEAAEAVAEEALRLDPTNGTATSAVFKAEAAGQLSKAFKLRFRRADEFLAVLYQVELSHIPFPDEPPILWPSAEVWQDLTERRKIWNRTTLKESSPLEEQISQALEEPYNAEFFATTRREILNDIQVNKKIPWTVTLDIDASSDVEALLDEEIDLVVSGVSLKTVLKRLVGSELSYLVRDEALEIITKEQAETEYFVYVYPVGDIVSDAQFLRQNALIGGGQNQQQQQGGQNQQGGGQGGGFGGGGGGFGGGGGGFGGGGGIFSVPPVRNRFNRPAPPAINNANPNLPVNVQNPEVQNLLNGILAAPQSSVTRKVELYQAQIRDDRAPVLGNKTLEQLKKKR